MVYPPVPPDREQPVELEDVPLEEDITPAEAAERLDEDPEDQQNFTDRAPDALAGDPDSSGPDPSEDT